MLQEMLGRVFHSVRKTQTPNGDDQLDFLDDMDKGFRFYHSQDCCEHVRIEDLCGDLADLEGAPILRAEETTSSDPPKHPTESFSWTFYSFSTIKGSVTVRWLGESNGYYSESVYLTRIERVAR